MMKIVAVNDNFHRSSYHHSDELDNVTRKYENHPRVKEIRETIKPTLYFSRVDKAYVQRSVGNLNSPKVETFKNIATKCLKATSDIYSSFFAGAWNKELILNKNFTQKMKACSHNTSL